MEKIEETFGTVVRQKRKSRQLSQESFAELAGVHRTYMSEIELGKVQVSIRVAERIAAALELPLSKLWREIERAAAKKN